MPLTLEWLQKVFTDTPVWVYGILLGFVIAGVVLSKSRIIPFKRIYRLPILLTAMSFGDLMTLYKLGDSYAAEMATYWSSALFIGLCLSWLNFRRFDVLIDKENQLIKMPGSWAHLLVLILFFLVKYYNGYLALLAPTQLSELNVKIQIAAGLGFCAGFYIGILLYVSFLKLKTTTEVSLK